MPVNVVSEWLNACAGYEISILNTAEAGRAQRLGSGYVYR